MAQGGSGCCEVLVLLGATPMRPREIYRLCFHLSPEPGKTAGWQCARAPPRLSFDQIARHQLGATCCTGVLLLLLLLCAGKMPPFCS